MLSKEEKKDESIKSLEKINEIEKEQITNVVDYVVRFLRCL